jgi:hypothetical protein
VQIHAPLVLAPEKVAQVVADIVDFFFHVADGISTSTYN